MEREKGLAISQAQTVGVNFFSFYHKFTGFAGGQRLRHSVEQNQQSMEIYKQVMSICSKARALTGTLIRDSKTKLPEDWQDQVNAELANLAELQGYGTMMLTSDQVKICKAIEAGRGADRVNLSPVVFFEGGVGRLYVTNAHALVRIEVEIVNPSKDSFFAYVLSIGKAVTLQPVSAAACKRVADFEVAIPQYKEGEGTEFYFQEELMYQAMTLCRNWRSIKIHEVVSRVLRVDGDAKDVAESFEDVRPHIQCHVKLLDGGEVNGYQCGVCPKHLASILSPTKHRTMWWQQRPNGAILIKKRGRSQDVYLVMPIMT